MNFARCQRGQLLVAGIVLIVVIALMISTLGFLYVSGQSASTLHGSSGAAYNAARAGIEVATYQYTVNATACASLTAGAQAVGTGGSFTLAGTAYNVSPPTANNTTVNAAQAFIPIGAGAIASYAPSGRVRIQTEEIDYSAKSTDSATCGGTPPCLVVSKRGAAGTTAAAHAAQAVYQNLCHVRSTGTSGRATRIVERSMHDAAAMMVYAKIGSGVANADYPRPFYRLWTGAAWSAEQTNASNFGLSGLATSIRWMALRQARTRNEAILATIHDDGSIRMQIWNGFQWFVPAALGAGGQLTTGIGASDTYRGVHIAYETATDRALIVYNNGTRNPQYRIWDGSTLSAQFGVNGAADLNGNYPTAGVPRWIRLAANPLPASNEIVMITLDSNADTSGIRWNGSNWATMEAGAPTVWFNDVSNGTSTVEAIALEYERVTGRAMFMWADNSTGDTTYRLWNGTTPIGAPVTFSIAAMGGRGQWLRLVAQPRTNNLLLGVQDSASDLNTRYWDGSSWDGAAQHPEHDGTVEQTTNQVFDLAFETHPSQIDNAWLVWANGNQVSTKKFTLTSCGGGSCWGATTNRGDDTSRIDVEAHPQTGAIFAMFYESSNANNPEEILEMRLTGGAGAWSGTTQIWGGRNDTNTNSEGRLHLAARRAISILTHEYFP